MGHDPFIAPLYRCSQPLVFELHSSTAYNLPCTQVFSFILKGGCSGIRCAFLALTCYHPRRLLILRMPHRFQIRLLPIHLFPNVPPLALAHLFPVPPLSRSLALTPFLGPSLAGILKCTQLFSVYSVSGVHFCLPLPYLPILAGSFFLRMPHRFQIQLLLIHLLPDVPSLTQVQVFPHPPLSRFLALADPCPGPVFWRGWCGLRRAAQEGGVWGRRAAIREVEGG